MKEYNIKAKATTYKGRHYRSILEVKWAIFFDYLGWQHEYEPLGFKGWLPDFALYGANKIILVEIKPIIEFNKEVADKISKINKGEYELLLLGLRPFCKGNLPILGWLLEKNDSEGDDWGEAPFNANGGYGFYHYHNSYEDRMTGEYNGYHHIVNPCWDDMEILWNQASNKAQWFVNE